MSSWNGFVGAIRRQDSVKILALIINGVSLVWSLVIGRRLFQALDTNGLTKALVSLFSLISLDRVWSIWVVWRVKTRFEVVASHLFLAVGLAVILEWLNSEMREHNNGQ